MAYIVIKTIRGRKYKYWQRAWREGKRVRTQCICLGRIDGDERKTHAAVGNTTPDTRDAWRSMVRDRLRAGESWLVEGETKEAVRTILMRLEVSEPEHIVSYLEELLRTIDVRHTQPRGLIYGTIEALRNTTGTHTDESLLEFLMETREKGDWQNPWRREAARRKTPLAVDERVLSIPVELGIAVRTVPFAENGAEAKSIRDGNNADGAWYARDRDTIQIPDGGRFIESSDGIGAADMFDPFEHTASLE